MATIQQLIADSEQIRDETIPGANSANRVGTLFKNISETFPDYGYYPNSKVFEINKNGIPRAAEAQLATLDYSIYPVEQRAYCLLIEYIVISFVSQNDASTQNAFNYVRGSYVCYSNKDNTTKDIITAELYLSPAAATAPGSNNITETILNVSFLDVFKLHFGAEVLITGSSGISISYRGWIRATDNGTRIVPDFTPL